MATCRSCGKPTREERFNLCDECYQKAQRSSPNEFKPSSHSGSKPPWQGEKN